MDLSLFLLGAITMAGALSGRELLRRLKQDKKLQDKPAKPGCRPGWVALPGGVIEYGATGWTVKITPNSVEQDFCLFDPEGMRRARANYGDLQVLQQLAEAYQAERMQFEPQRGSDPLAAVRGRGRA